MTQTTKSEKLVLAQKKEKALKAIAKEPLVFNELGSELFRDEDRFDWDFCVAALAEAKAHYEKRIVLAANSDESQRILEEAKETHKTMQETIKAEEAALLYVNQEKARKAAQLEELTQLYAE